MRALVCSYPIACAFWLVLFSPWPGRSVPFWATMTAATGVLAGLGLWFSRRTLRPMLAWRRAWLPIAVVGAAGLYLVFWLGRIVSVALFDFAAGQIDSVYALRPTGHTAAIAMLLVLWIPPAEEIFWRGFLQRRLMVVLGPRQGFIAGAILYAAAHVWAWNAMLIVAALICGLVWGWMMLRWRSLWPGILSHAAWDLTIFVLLPLA